MSNEELEITLNGIEQIVEKSSEWSEEYIYDKSKNEYYHKTHNESELNKIKKWFTI